MQEWRIFGPEFHFPVHKRGEQMKKGKKKNLTDPKFDNGAEKWCEGVELHSEKLGRGNVGDFERGNSVEGWS